MSLLNILSKKWRGWNWKKMKHVVFAMMKLINNKILLIAKLDVGKIYILSAWRGGLNINFKITQKSLVHYVELHREIIYLSL